MTIRIRAEDLRRPRCFTDGDLWPTQFLRLIKTENNEIGLYYSERYSPTRSILDILRAWLSLMDEKYSLLSDLVWKVYAVSWKHVWERKDSISVLVWLTPIYMFLLVYQWKHLASNIAISRLSSTLPSDCCSNTEFFDKLMNFQSGSPLSIDVALVARMIPTSLSSTVRSCSCASSYCWDRLERWFQYRLRRVTRFLVTASCCWWLRGSGAEFENILSLLNCISGWRIVVTIRSALILWWYTRSVTSVGIPSEGLLATWL